jgi:hypothetical protein
MDELRLLPDKQTSKLTLGRPGGSASLKLALVSARQSGHHGRDGAGNDDSKRGAHAERARGWSKKGQLALKAKSRPDQVAGFQPLKFQAPVTSDTRLSGKFSSNSMCLGLNLVAMPSLTKSGAAPLRQSDSYVGGFGIESPVLKVLAATLVKVTNKGT